jgi:RNA polymerase sigma factor (sigma-70 family)
MANPNDEQSMTAAPDSDSLPTRASLLSRVRDVGNAEGWSEFFKRYRDLIRRLALRAGLNDSEADDVLQETMTCLARQLPEFRYDPARGSFKGWLSTIVRRRVIDQLRKRRPEQPLDDAALERSYRPDEHWDDGMACLPCTRGAGSRPRCRIAAAVSNVRSLRAPAHEDAGHQAPAQRERAQVYMAKMRVGTIFKRELESLRGEVEQETG